MTLTWLPPDKKTKILEMLIFASSSVPLDGLSQRTPEGNFIEYAQNHLFHPFVFSYQEVAFVMVFSYLQNFLITIFHFPSLWYNYPTKTICNARPLLSLYRKRKENEHEEETIMRTYRYCYVHRLCA